MARTAIHPGEHLAEELRELGISAAELSRQIELRGRGKRRRRGAHPRAWVKATVTPAVFLAVQMLADEPGRLVSKKRRMSSA
jgi:hypothetical protein